MADSLARIARELPPGFPDSVELIWVLRRTDRTVSRTYLTYQLRWPDGWAVSDMVVAEELGIRFLDQWGVHRLPVSLQEINAFTLTSGPVASHLIVLALALASVGYSLFACVAVISTPMPYRWAWGLVALIGLGALRVNWNTGAVDHQLFAAQLLSIGALRVGSIYGPWVLMLSFPAGAIAAMQRRAQFKRRQR